MLYAYSNYTLSKNMQQFSVSVPKDVLAVLRIMSEQSGESVSSIANRLIRDGLSKELELLNRIEIYSNLIRKKQNLES
jgi:metal-responsive CopG/Arc/MetJ family transcriptional regulator